MKDLPVINSDRSYRLINSAASSSGCASPLWWEPNRGAARYSNAVVRADESPMISPPNPGEEIPQPMPNEHPVNSPNEIPERRFEELSMPPPMKYVQANHDGTL